MHEIFYCSVVLKHVKANAREINAKLENRFQTICALNCVFYVSFLFVEEAPIQNYKK